VNVHGQVVVLNRHLSGNSGPAENAVSSELDLRFPQHGEARYGDLIKTGKVSRGYLGVSIRYLDDGWQSNSKVPDTAGALAEDVTAGGPADKAG